MSQVLVVRDISLNTGGKVLDGADKCLAMQAAADDALGEVSQAVQSGTEVVVGIGGGTGGEIILSVLRALPVTFPKVLVSTLPFDPRAALSDNAIILVPTLADLSGLNAILRDALENTAHVTAGLCTKARKGELTQVTPSVGITGLGATDTAVRSLVDALAAQGRESTVFHSNGYGGAAFARFAAHGAFDAIVDLTPHELTRLHIGGAHVSMPGRFSAGSALPRIVLPGGLNFIGLGPKSTLAAGHRSRPHYEHSGYFSHVKMTPDEIALLAGHMARNLNALDGPCAVILPMGGFSHQDRPGGEIEDPALRAVFRDALTGALAPRIAVTELDAHLFDARVTGTIMTTLAELTARKDL